MGNLMRAGIWYGPEDVRIEEVPIPDIDDNGVLIKTKVSLTCGTDVKTYFRGHPSIKPGMYFGHELAGDIVKVGKNVTKFKIGDRVVPHNTAPCGKCYYCKRGQNDGICEDRIKIKGGHAEYCAVPGRIVDVNMFQIPDDVAYEAAALTEPLSCAVYCADKTPVIFGDTVVILGAGPIGLMIAFLIKKKGARVVQADFSASRLEVAESLGVDKTLNLTGIEDPVNALRALTNEGRGADVVIDATGQPGAWENCVKIARKGGLCNLFGGCKEGTTITIDTRRIHYDEVKIVGYFHTTPLHVEMSNRMLANHEIPYEKFVTGKFPFEQLIDAIKGHANQEGIKNAIIY